MLAWISFLSSIFHLQVSEGHGYDDHEAAAAPAAAAAKAVEIESGEQPEQDFRVRGRTRLVQVCSYSGAFIGVVFSRLFPALLLSYPTAFSDKVQEMTLLQFLSSSLVLNNIAVF